jgi:hypothetical protein
LGNLNAFDAIACAICIGFGFEILDIPSPSSLDKASKDSLEVVLKLRIGSMFSSGC